MKLTYKHTTVVLSDENNNSWHVRFTGTRGNLRVKIYKNERYFGKDSFGSGLPCQDKAILAIKRLTKTRFTVDENERM